MAQDEAISRVSTVDPQVCEFVQRLSEAYASHGTPADVADRRRIAELVRRPWVEGGPKMAETRDFTIAGLRLRLHRPDLEANCPVLLYVHGGGWVLFSIDTHDRLMREYAARAGIAVLGVDYSRSPEAKFPVALDEVGRVLDWIEAEGADISLDPRRILIGGDSVGANLATAACLKRRDQGRAKLSGMLLSYGAFDPKRTASYDRYSGPDYTLEALEMDAFWSAYTDHPGQYENPLVSPLRAQLHDLPPAFLAVAECDILADSSYAFADKLRKAGVPVELVTYHGATHSFLEAVSVAPLAGRALDDQARWIRERVRDVRPA